MKCLLPSSIIACLLCLAGTANASINLINNGGFEADPGGGSFTTYSSLTDWTVTGTVDVIGGYWPSYELSQSLDLNGNGPATISQSFATVSGETYLFSFAYGNNPDGPGSSMDVSIDGTGNLFSLLGLSHITSTKSNMDYVVYSGSFVADSTSSTLTFVGLTTGPFGIALDDVQVQAVPEPATMAIWGVGALGFGVVAARRRKLAAK